jgi:hypothetical protein
VSVLVVAQSNSEIPEGLMNNPVYSVLTVVEQKLVMSCHVNYSASSLIKFFKSYLKKSSN